MTLSHFSVVRPVVTTVLMLLLTVFGLLAMQSLAVREYPDIDTPTISISTAYTGASANVVETKITQIIEDAVSGIEGLDNLSSESRDGNSRVTLEFIATRNIDAAANDVRDKVSRVLSRLPDTADSPVIAKFDSSGMPVLIVSLTSSQRTSMELCDYARRYLLDRYSVLDGVAEAQIFGAQEQSMRIWLDRQRLAAKGITVGDIENVLRNENIETPGGRIESAAREFTVRISRQYHTADDFGKMLIKRNQAGDFVRLNDVATITIAPRSQRQSLKSNKEPMIGIGIYKQSTANTLAVAEAAKKLTDELQTNVPPDMHFKILRDESRFIKASIKEVRETLIIAAILVLAIIFFFLGNLRALLIPAFTVPLSLVATFIVLAALGYSINLLTLLAFVLAIGMVVDDTIVMLENIHRRIEDGEKPLLAAVRGSNQVFFAVIATTVVLIATFMPICLWAGKTGKIFTEFAVALTAAVCFSSLIALTLTPMLCAKLLKTRAEDTVLSKMVDFLMGRVESVYDYTLRLAAKVKILSTCCFAAICILMIWGWQQIPSEYEPYEDRAAVMMQMQAPEGTNFYAMSDYGNEITNILYPIVESGVAHNLMVVIPTFGDTNGAVNRGFCTLELVDWDARKETASEVLTEVRRRLINIAGATVQPYLPTGISGRGSPVQFVIGGPDYDELVKWRDKILARCQDYPGLVDVQYDYKETTPQLHVNIDRERANELGISASVIGSTLETMLGSRRVTTFVDRGREYDVILQADRLSRATPTNLSNIYVRSQNTSDLIPLDNLINISERGDSGRLSRYNRVRAITLSGNVAPGYALSDVLDFLNKTANEELPEYKQIFYKGQSKDMLESSASLVWIFALALIISYLTLAAQFESFASPLIVMLTVPLGMIGAVTALNFMGLTLNIYTQIGIIMLIGLAAKNGILIVEFANQLRDNGLEFTEALFTAAKLRIRPILMTGISTVAGAVPLLLATGAGAAGRSCLGAVVVFGGLSSCILTLYIVPIAYLILARWNRPPNALSKQVEKLIAENPEMKN